MFKQWISLTAFALTCSWTVADDAKTISLDVGSPAPVFEAKDDTGKLWKSTDYIGKKPVVVFFYPAALTGGWTKQACGFRDAKNKYERLGAVVVGVSGDSVEGQALFKKAEKLNFPLLSDYEGKVAKAFGVPVRKGGTINKNILGKQHSITRGVSASRWTFVIGKDGKIAYKNTKVKAAKDSEEVLAALTPEAIEVGSSAPAFEAKDDTGKLWRSTDHVGKRPIVIFFYPAALTGGWTKQACGFRDAKKTFEDLGAVVIGVSGDSVEGQALFKKAEKLNFPLLADPEGKVAKAFGVPTRDGGTIKKVVLGKERAIVRGITASRWTFVIGKNGKIIHKNTKVKAAEDWKSAVAALKQ